MQRIVKLSCLVLLSSLVSCYEKEIFSDIPKIEFDDLVFFDAPPGLFDTLALSFRFENGGDDFGIDLDQDIFPPYNDFNFFIDSNDSIVTSENYDQVSLPIYKVPAVLRNLFVVNVTENNIFFAEGGDSYVIFGFRRDTLQTLNQMPPLECPNITNQSGSYDTASFELYDFIDNTLTSKSVAVQGDILVERVDTHYNLLVSFEERVNGEFEPIDWQRKFGTENCEIGIFSAPVPFFGTETETGKITYKLKSAGFIAAFLDNEIGIRFQIIDRALNRSNEVFHVFTLPDITQ